MSAGKCGVSSELRPALTQASAPITAAGESGGSAGPDAALAAGALQGVPRSVADSPYANWQLEDYLKTYYGTSIAYDEQLALAYQVAVLRLTQHEFQRGLEYGAGPTMHRAIAAARYVQHIDMTDWLPGNLAHLRHWLDASSTNCNWRRFTQYILWCENDSFDDVRSAESREQHTRKVVRDLSLSDARWRHPLGAVRDGFYDLIISGFCIDAVSGDKRVWASCMRNVLTMLSSGGLLVMYVLHRCKAYRVGNQLFPSANLTADDVFSSLNENRFIRSSIDVEVVRCQENDELGYSAILMISARKA